MAVDATGTPTTKFSIPKFNVNVDAPSGLGSNAQMDALDALIASLGIAGLTANDVPVYDSVSGLFKKASGTPSSSTFLRGDGTWATASSNTTTSAWSGGPPASPANGDIWIATNPNASWDARWMFQYDSAWVTDAFKWKLIGGSELLGSNNLGGTTYTGLTQIGATGWYYNNVAAQIMTAGRAGVYAFGGSGYGLVSGGLTAQASLSLSSPSAATTSLVNSRRDVTLSATTTTGGWAFKDVVTATAAQTFALSWSGSAAFLIADLAYSQIPIRII